MQVQISLLARDRQRLSPLDFFGFLTMGPQKGKLKSLLKNEKA